MFYKLVDKEPVPCTGQEWAEWYEPTAVSGKRIVARDELYGMDFSTIFTGIDQSTSGKGPPLLFETMTFVNGKSTGVAIRYATWREAEAGHRRMVMKTRSEMADAE
jgi:hypothetical protein